MNAIATATARWLDFITSPRRASCMIYGPTQMGKTAMAELFVRKCLDSGIPVIISTDNRTDQLDQFYSRFKDAFALDTSTTILRVTDKKFAQKVVSVLHGNRRLLLFLLNNASQIDALRGCLREAMIGDDPKNDLHLPKILVLHDEGDVVSKDKNVKKTETGQASSHQSWIRISQLLGSRSVLKRAFLTATPENVVYLYDDIEKIIRLPVPSNGYVHYETIRFFPMDDVDDGPSKALRSELERIQRGAILFCTERVIEEGHDEVFHRLCDEMKSDGVVHTYNGRGIMTCCWHPRFLHTLKILVKEENLKTKTEIVSKHRNIYRFTGISISHFYEVCRRLQLYKIVTIGMDLMSRGISFVSSAKNVQDTIAATTMIYTPGTTMHAVGLIQAIGRITGKACPDLERRLYAPPQVIENYLKAMRIQKEYLDKIENSKNAREDMMRLHHRYRLSVSLDRIRLGLKPLYAKRCFTIDIQKHNESAKRRSQETKNSKDMIDGVNVQWLTTEMKNKISDFTFIVQELEKEKGGITIENLKKNLEKKIQNIKDILHLGSSSNVKGARGKIWIMEEIERKVMIRLNPKIRHYL